MQQSRTAAKESSIKNVLHSVNPYEKHCLDETEHVRRSRTDSRTSTKKDLQSLKQLLLDETEHTADMTERTDDSGTVVSFNSDLSMSARWIWNSGKSLCHEEEEEEEEDNEKTEDWILDYLRKNPPNKKEKESKKNSKTSSDKEKRGSSDSDLPPSGKSKKSTKKRSSDSDIPSSRKSKTSKKGKKKSQRHSVPISPTSESNKGPLSPAQLKLRKLRQSYMNEMDEREKRRASIRRSMGNHGVVDSLKPILSKTGTKKHRPLPKSMLSSFSRRIDMCGCEHTARTL